VKYLEVMSEHVWFVGVMIRLHACMHIAEVVVWPDGRCSGRGRLATQLTVI